MSLFRTATTLLGDSRHRITVIWATDPDPSRRQLEIPRSQDSGWKIVVETEQGGCQERPSTYSTCVTILTPAPPGPPVTLQPRPGLIKGVTRTGWLLTRSGCPDTSPLICIWSLAGWVFREPREGSEQGGGRCGELSEEEWVEESGNPEKDDKEICRIDCFIWIWNKTQFLIEECRSVMFLGDICQEPPLRLVLLPDEWEQLYQIESMSA